MSSVGARSTMCLSVEAEHSKRQDLCVPQMGLYWLPLATVSPTVKQGSREGQAGKCL